MGTICIQCLAGLALLQHQEPFCHVNYYYLNCDALLNLALHSNYFFWGGARGRREIGSQVVQVGLEPLIIFLHSSPRAVISGVYHHARL